MKRKLLNLCIGGGVAAALIFTSCDNFMEGSLLKNELDTTLEDANTERCNVSVFALNSDGTLTGETGGSYKLGTTGLSLGFEENKGIQFVEWQVKDSSGNLSGSSATDAVFISNPYSTKTSFSVLKSASGYKIEAVCAARPSVELASPSYIASGVNSDSAIEVTFSQTVDESNFIFTQEEFAAYGNFAKSIRRDSSDETSPIVGIELAGEKIYKNILITDSENKNISAHYNSPVLSEDGKKLVLEADTSKTFDYKAQPTKDIFVTVSAKIGYDHKTQTGKTIKILPEKAYDYNFKVSATTTAKAKIDFSAKNEEGKVMGTFNYSGLQEFNIGQRVQVEFTPNRDFDFVGWDIFGNEDNAVSTKADGATIVVNVLKASDTVRILPVCEQKAKAQILFSCTNGTVNPLGYIDCVQGQVIPLSFTCDSSYTFVSWKVVNSNTGETVDKAISDLYYEFEDANSPTTVLTIKYPKDVYSIVADCYVRPHVYSHYPDISSGSGIRLDQSVKIFFDHDMDKMSFYYTEDEAVQVQKKVNFSVFLSDSTGRYGYTTTDNDQYFKNISITNRATGENYTKYYKQPELIDPQTLVVPVNVILKNSGGTYVIDEDKNIPAYTEVKFQLGNSVGYYAENGTLVPLVFDSNCTWFYTNNGSRDANAPTITQTSLKTYDGTVAVGKDISKSKPVDKATLKAAYLASGGMKYDVSVNDTSSNLSSLTLKYRRIKTINKDNKIGTLDDVTNPTVYSKALNLVTKDKINGTCAGTINFFTFTSDGNKEVSKVEGIYELWFESMDESANIGKSASYYIVIDTVKPGDTVDVSSMKYLKNGRKIKLCDWEQKPKPFDYESTKMYVTYTDSTNASYSMDGVTKLIFEKDIKEVTVVSEDVFGNRTTIASKFYGYKTGLENNDYFYTNGWYSSKDTLYKEYECYARYFNHNSTGYLVKAYSGNTINLSDVDSKLAEMNNGIPATLKGKMTWTYPDESFPLVAHNGEKHSDEDNSVVGITGITTCPGYSGPTRTWIYFYIKVDSILKVHRYSCWYTSVGYVDGIYKMGYIFSDEWNNPGYYGTESNSGYLVAISQIPTGDFE